MNQSKAIITVIDPVAETKRALARKQEEERKKAEESRLKAEQEAKQKAEQEARLKAEQETRKKVSASQDQNTSATVYWVPNGEVYYSTSGCSTLKRSKNIYSGTISESGKSRPCKVCH